MRALVILRGPQSSGKSRLISDLGLGDYTLSLDSIRNLVRGPVMSEYGFVNDQSSSYPALDLLKGFLDSRMKDGEFLVVESIHEKVSDLHVYQELAQKHRYKLVCVDFFPLVSAEKCKQRNMLRNMLERADSEAIDRTLKVAEGFSYPSDIELLSPKEFHEWFDSPRIYDLTGFSSVLHIGDIQGCFDPLAEVFKNGIDENTFYVFTGDYLDRGLQNAKVMAFMLSIYERSNVVCLWGNHENHLHKYARSLHTDNAVFEGQTRPELELAGITREQIDHFCDALVDIFLYRHGQHHVQVTHGGLHRAVSNPLLLPSRQARSGTGRYKTPVDILFDKNESGDWYQVHGRRNIGALPTRASERSYNLEGAVEFGGSLRMVLLNDGGFSPVSVVNPTYRAARDREHRDHDTVPSWIQLETQPCTTLTARQLCELDAHQDITKKEYAGVRSFSYSPSNTETEGLGAPCVARGLFVDAGSLEVIARGYDKFYQWGEPKIESADPCTLRQEILFPVSSYIQENGFFGLVGVTPEGELFYSSKSTPNSRHARILKERVEGALSEGGRVVLARWLRDYEACLAFEVIEPLADPHIIEYDQPRLVLLDVIRRSLAFEKMPHQEAKNFAKLYGFESKTFHGLHRSWDALEAFVKQVRAGGNYDPKRSN